jgi:hypothetical protein
MRGEQDGWPFIRRLTTMARYVADAKIPYVADAEVADAEIVVLFG